MLHSRRITVSVRLICLGVLALMVVGCATSPKVQVVQMGDDQLSCRELLSEMRRLDEAEANVEAKKGVTGTNVAAALFWLPGLAYTYYDAGQANQLISERKSHLTALYNKQACSGK